MSRLARDKRREATTSATNHWLSTVPGEGPSRLGHVVDAEAQVMQPLAMRCEKGGHGVVGVERLDELNERVPGVQIGEANGRYGPLLARDDLQSEPTGEVLECLFRVTHGDRHVVEPSKRGHDSSPL